MPNFTHQRHPHEPIDVLHVEDNDGDIRLTREAFSATDRETTLHVVDDGDDTVDFLRQQGRYESVPRPDLVLFDLNLPGRDGHDVLEAIEDAPQLRRLPVIVLTGSNRSEDIVTCYRTHANAYVPKPSTLEEFVSLVTAIEAFWLDHAQLPPSSA